MNIFKNWYDYFIIFIVLIKLLHYTFYGLYLFLKVFNKENTKIFRDIVYLKNTSLNIFNNSMAILLIYLFNPYFPVKEIDSVVKSLLFLYAFVLILQSQWITYINESELVIYLKKILGIKDFS
jgi:hypothetical protein